MKEIKRSSQFQAKKQLNALSTVSKSKVNIGFMKLEASGNQKKCRGKSSPVKVSDHQTFSVFCTKVWQSMGITIKRSMKDCNTFCPQVAQA